MWAVGCIFAELYGRRPLFIGNDQIHQASEIVKVLGTPTKEVMLKYGSGLVWDLFSPPAPQFQPLKWVTVYPFASAAAHNLMSKLICWEAEERYTVTEALSDPYLKEIRDLDDEPSATESFDFEFEIETDSLNGYKILIHEEVEQFKIDRLGSLRSSRYNKNTNQ